MRSLLKHKLCGYTTRVCFLLLFVFSINSNAQTSFTDPSITDLRLAQSAVSSCDILQEVTKIEATSLSSQEFFDKLQKIDSNGNLLIDTEGCTESILQFVSSLCSSNSNTNRSFCNTLGFSVDTPPVNISNTGEGDYKSYGSSALESLDLNNSNVQAQNSNNPTLSNEGSSTFSVTSGVSVAGLLISFTPIKRLKLVRNLVRPNGGYTTRVVASRIKPVLSGAMLILATLGLSSCGDVTEPDPDPIIETPCTRGEPGYFQLTSSSGTNSASNCIKLIDPPTVSYLDSEGNVVTNTNDISDHSIKITFEEAVGFIDATDHGNLTPENVVKMVDIKLGNIDLLDVGFGFTIEIESDETSFTLAPETNTSGVTTYPAGDYVVGVSNYAKKADISKIANATNRAGYLSRVNSMSQSLSSFSVHTPCSRGEDGYFELRNTNGLTDCIKLILPTISYLDEEGNLTEDTSTITNHSIKVSFEEPVSFINESEQSDLSEENILEMMDVRLGDTDLLDVGFGFTIEISSDETSFTLKPDTNYPAGDYVVGVSNYAKKADISKIATSTNKAQYLNTISNMSNSLSSFTVPVIPTSCTNNEPGYFELTNDNLTTSCIKLPQVSFTFTSNEESSSEHNGDPATIIQIEFDSKIVYIGDGTATGGVSTSSSLTKSDILEMVEITNSAGVDLVSVDGPIGEDQVSVTESSGNSAGNSSTVITINPPNDNRYELGMYTLSVGGYAKTDDADLILASNNTQSYLTIINQEQSFNIQTPCGRGDEGYFELTYDDTAGDCIKLISPTISYLDSEGNVTTDTSTISDHSIKVTFDGRVSYIDSDRYEGLTAAFARNMIELNANGTNLLTSTFRFSIEAGVEEDENSFFILTPISSYPAGSYSVKVKNYASSLNVSKVLDATNTEDYLASINKEYSSFSTPNISTLCEEDASGYFELTYDDGTRDCIRIPQVVYTFTPRGGREMIESTWDPTEVIKIYFDSEVVYLSNSGEWQEITKEDILEMIEISGKTHDDVDYVSTNGPMGLDLVSVSHTSGKTIITIESPYDPRTWEGKIYDQLAYGYYEHYNIIVKNFARRSDVSKITNSSSVDSYLEDTTTFYHGQFGARYYNATSCDLEYRQSAASYDQYHDRYNDEEVLDHFACGTDIAQSFSHLPDNIAFDGANDDETPQYEKADPATRYIIDVAFVISDSYLEKASGDWRGYLKNTLLERVSKVFQESGVNVEFRASNISFFSEYKQYLLCDLPSLDNLVIARKREGRLGWGHLYGDQVAISELIPSIRKKHHADIVISMIPDNNSYASLLPPAGETSYYAVPRWESYATVGTRHNFFDLNGISDIQTKVGTSFVSTLMAHEIGHVLGLSHDIDSLVEINRKNPESLTRPGTTATGFGYGYGGQFSDEPISTIMSYGRLDQFIPLFSADREILRAELCGNEDTSVGIWTSLGYGYCFNSDPDPDRSIRLGGPYKYGTFVDATESLQYTIKYVSEYHDLGVAPLDLSTVSNAITAKALRTQH